MVRTKARAALLSDWMSGRFGKEVQVDVAPDYAALERAIDLSSVDLAWAPPAICARVYDVARFVLKAVRNGRSSYCSALVGRATTLPTLASLGGLRAAWVDPLSTGGHLLAVAHLRAAGIEPATTFAEERFLGSYRDALIAVAHGSADVTAVFTRIEEPVRWARTEMADLVGPAGDALSPFAITGEAPHDGLVLTRGLGHAEAEKLAAALLGLEHHASAPTMLLEVCNAQSFVPASPHDYRHLDPRLLAA